MFLASPGGVDEERDIVLAEVQSFNTGLGRSTSRVVQLRRWEDRPPSAGEPQLRINPDVESCDLFVGVVGEWWGTPTPRATSGFAEEFDLALKRFKATGAPEIQIFVKHIAQGRRRDPGPQLEQVLAFRQRLEREHLALYVEYDEPGNFAERFRDALGAFAVSFVKPTQQFAAQGLVSASPTPAAGQVVAEPTPATQRELRVATLVDQAKRMLDRRRDNAVRAADDERLYGQATLDAVTGDDSSPPTLTALLTLVNAYAYRPATGKGPRTAATDFGELAAAERAMQPNNPTGAWHFWPYVHLAEYAGPVWLQLNLPGQKGDTQSCELAITWGVYRWRRALELRPREHCVILYSKARDEGWPQIIATNPPTTVRFGIGEPPAATHVVVATDEGWRRWATDRQSTGG